MFKRISDRLFGLKRIGMYLTDSELREAYAEFKESEEMAFRLIVNSLLAEGWLVTLSRPVTLQELASEHDYTNNMLLENILNLLVANDIVELKGEKYTINQIKTTPIRPEDIGTVLTNFYYDCATFLPAALRGKTVSIDQVPRVVLESVFTSTLTEVGRSVLLRSFSSKDSEHVGVAAFADVGLPYTIKQIDEILSPKTIDVFLNDYRWLGSITSLLRLSSEEQVLDRLSAHLLKEETGEDDFSLDLFYGEELFAWSLDSLDQRVQIISSYLRPGGRLITDDPTTESKEDVTSAAYVLMQVIEGYPQPISRELIKSTFSAHSLNVQTIGDNWIIAEKVGD